MKVYVVVIRFTNVYPVVGILQAKIPREEVVYMSESLERAKYVYDSVAQMKPYQQFTNSKGSVCRNQLRPAECTRKWLLETELGACWLDGLLEETAIHDERIQSWGGGDDTIPKNAIPEVHKSWLSGDMLECAWFNPAAIDLVSASSSSSSSSSCSSSTASAAATVDATTFVDISSASAAECAQTACAADHS